jgi:superfamily II DNA/RNA helicase
MKAEIPDTLRQNLMQCGTWARPPSLLEKYMITAGLSHRDVLCIAPAGSGQTRAFLVPILHNMMVGLKDTKERSAPKKICFPDTLVLCPTQEGAAECHQVASTLLRGSRFRCVCLHHRQSITEQVQDLALGVDVLIATPASLGELRHMLHTEYL